jgi:hypothetical protein
MEKVRLETSAGSLVGYALIPVITPRPEVLIIDGARVFKAAWTGANAYSECFAFVVTKWVGE